MSRCRADFLVEPFEEGNQGAHVVAAIEAVRRNGLEPAVGAFSTTVEGATDQVRTAVDAMIRAALEGGATRVSVNITVVD